MAHSMKAPVRVGVVQSGKHHNGCKSCSVRRCRLAHNHCEVQKNWREKRSTREHIVHSSSRRASALTTSRSTAQFWQMAVASVAWSARAARYLLPLSSKSNGRLPIHKCKHSVEPRSVAHAFSRLLANTRSTSIEDLMADYIRFLQAIHQATVRTGRLASSSDSPRPEKLTK